LAGLRILFVVEQYADEGARYYREFFRGLQERDCEVGVFNFSRSDRFAADVEEYVDHMEQLGLVSAYRRGRRRLRALTGERTIDVVQGMETLASYHAVVALGGSRHRPGLVYGRRHGRTLGWTHKWMDQVAASGVDRVIAVSPATAAICRREHPLVARKVVAIRSGVMIDPLPPEEGAIPEDHADGFTVLLLSRLRPIKGHDTALKAAAQLRDRIPNLRLRFVGEGPHREEIERLRSSLDLDSVVCMPGHTDDVARELARADVMIIPSYADAFPKVGVEAFAAGVPVVASEVEGLADLVENGRTGLLLPPGDVDALAGAILELFEDRVRLRALGDAAKAEYSTHYTVETMTDAYLDVYREIAEDRARGR
jgi:glycosyltransferase involved in cell wall biosynthesis